MLTLCQKERLIDSFRWPAIAGIIIASLIILSVLWCFARCLCCGVSCCCPCFSCCDNCAVGRKRSRYADHPPSFAPAPYPGYQPAPPPPAYEFPRFATFDAPSKGAVIHDDSLPAMPSWENATSKRIERYSHNDLEMGRLESQGAHGAVLPGIPGSRGGYAQVPPQSPTDHGPDIYRGAQTTHPYGSDLGAQRLATHDTGYPGYSSTANATYDSAQDRPFSAPYESQNALGTYGRSPVSPTQHTLAPLTSTTSTRYEPTEYQAPSTSYNSANQQRPPSLLQVGRKPVSGSAREI